MVSNCLLLSTYQQCGNLLKYIPEKLVVHSNLVNQCKAIHKTCHEHKQKVSKSIQALIARSQTPSMSKRLSQMAVMWCQVQLPRHKPSHLEKIFRLKSRIHEMGNSDLVVGSHELHIFVTDGSDVMPSTIAQAYAITPWKKYIVIKIQNSSHHT